MFASSTVAVLVTGVFVATGAYSLVRLMELGSGHGCGGSKVAETSHLLMSLGMIAMIWSWVGGPSSGGGLALIVLFGVFAVWFLARALVPAPGHLRLVEGYHVVMNAAMVWMVAAMPMTMTGGDHASHGMSGAEMVTSAWPTAISWAFVVGVLASAVLWAIRAARRETSQQLDGPASGPAPGSTAVLVRRSRPRTGPRLDAGCHVLMSLGMAGMLLIMV